MKGTPDRRRISSYSAINYSYPCFPLHKYHTSRSYDKQAREQEQILVINCQSDAAAGDIVRIRWMYSQFSAAGPDGTQIFSAPPPDQSSCRTAPRAPGRTGSAGRVSISCMYAQACLLVNSSYPHQPYLKYTLQHCSVCYVVPSAGSDPCPEETEA